MPTFSVYRGNLPIHGRDALKRFGAWTAGIMLMSTSLVACGPLEPIVEQEVSDLQLTVDTLRTSLRDSQRTIAELRSELEARRQELADSQIARAQMEGRIREAERRLTESRHVIELQREELASSRIERQRVSQTGAALQNQLKQLRKQLSKMGKQFEQSGESGAAPANLSSSRTRPSTVRPVIMSPDIPGIEREVTPAGTGQFNSALDAGDHSDAQGIIPSSLSVKPGDTLWSIAQRFHVTIRELMVLNELPDQRILVGQALRLPSSVASKMSPREKSE